MSTEVTQTPNVETANPVYRPLTDIVETSDGVHIMMEMPGVAAEELDVDLEKGVLSVRSRARPFIPEGFELVHAEYEAGNFERAFTLSDTVDPTKIKARMQNGVLTLILPRSKEAQVKKIEVKAG